MDFTSLEQPDVVPFPDLLSPESLGFNGQVGIAQVVPNQAVANQTVANQTKDARIQEFFSPDVQAQLPSISEVMSGSVGPGQLANSIPGETSSQTKKPRSRKKTVSKNQPINGASLQGFMEIPDLGLQMAAPAFGLDQVMASDPFVSSSVSLQQPKNGQVMFSVEMASTPQTAAAQAMAQVPAMTPTPYGVTSPRCQTHSRPSCSRRLLEQPPTT
jgi:hypothetical protein